MNLGVPRMLVALQPPLKYWGEAVGTRERESAGWEWPLVFIVKGREVPRGPEDLRITR